ncbi:hypothetical protein EBZ38_09570 [bacterium]|nr:hypothetical protein [bacterium]
MADNLKAAALAAGLSEKEFKLIQGLNKAQNVHRELLNLPAPVAQNVYETKLTPAQQISLKQTYGEDDPVTKPNRGWLGTAWHYTGGAVASGFGKVLAGLQNVSDFSTRLYRTAAIAGTENISLADAWDEANDKGDKKFNADRIAAARAKYGIPAISVAMKLSSGEDFGKIAKEATPEEQKYLMLASKKGGTPEEQENFQDAIDTVSAAKYSPGRQIANLVDAITPGDLVKNGFMYKALSGAVDAAYRVFADPLLVAGKIKRGVDVSRYALDVVIGGEKVDKYFSQANNIAFWDRYGGLLKEYKTAKTAGDTVKQVDLAKQMSILAPEFGPTVIDNFISVNLPVQDALSAKAFFQNAKNLDEIMKGQIGRRRVLMPTLNAQRKARVAFLTGANKVFNIDRIGPTLIDDTFFGEAATDDGIAKSFTDGVEKIVTQLKANANPKEIGYFSTAMVKRRIDKFGAKFTPIPYAAMEGMDLLAKDSPQQMYRLARLIMPKRESQLFAQSFSNADEGTRKLMYQGMWQTIADFKGMSTSETGQTVTRFVTGKEKPTFALTVKGKNPSVPLGTEESIALVPTDLSSWVSAPSMADVNRLVARDTLIKKIMGIPHSAFAEKMTSAWVFLTLAGPRYAIRNATEDLMVNLAIGKNPWGLPVAKHLSTRFRTALQMPKGLTKYEKVVENPLGIIMRIVNKNEAEKYAAEAKKFQEAGDLEGVRQVFADALTQGKMNRFYKSIGLGKVVEREAALLSKQIKYGDINNALQDVVESGKALNTGLDYTTSAINYQRSSGSRLVALEVNVDKNIKRVKGGKGYARQAPLQDDASKTAWLLRVGYYANDELATRVLANLDDPKKAIDLARKWLDDNPQTASRFRWKDFEVDNQGHAENIYAAVKQIMVKADDETINTDLLNKIRTWDDATQQYKITGKLSIDDLPTTEADAPSYIIGPKLIAVSESGNYTASIQELGYKWLGEANARMSREPIVFWNMIQMRKDFEDTGFEAAYIKSHLMGIDPSDTKAIEKAKLVAERKLAEIVEDRARLQTLAFVDNPMIQSQFAFSIRNFARFYRASEDFARRITRVVKYNPEALVKASLTYEGITHSGWIQEDDKGEPYFVYPGMTQVYRVVQGVMQALGVPAEFKTPFPVEFGAKVKMLTPSLNPDSIMPTFAGPLAAVSTKVMSNLVSIWSPGAADTITRIALGPYAEDQPMVSAFLPAHVNRIYAAMNQDERDGQYASAMRKAMTYLEASGNGLVQKYTTNDAGEKVPVPFTAQELENYRVRLKNTTLSVLGLRVIFGLFAPASPQVQLRSDMAEWVRDNGKANFKQAWYSVLSQYPGDYDAAMKKWVELYPDQIPFTVSESDRSTVAYFRYAEESGNFVDQNQDLFKRFPQGAAFLIPHKEGYSWDAYKTMTDMGLRKNKTVSDFLREVQTAADMQTYFERKDTFEKSLTEVGTDYERAQLRKEWNDWAKVFKAGRPLVQEELAQGGKRAIERTNALNDLRNMLDDKNVYRISPVTAKTLKQMLDVYDKYVNNKKELQSISGSRFLIQVEEDDALIKLKQLADTNENTRSAYAVLFSRLMGE